MTRTDTDTRRSIRAHLVAIAAAALFLVLGIGVIGATTELAGAINRLGRAGGR